MSGFSENISIDDSVLVKKAKIGDSAAIERLIVRYQDRIFNVILKICSNYEDAAELTQETFVKFIEKIDSFKGNSSFYTWLFRVAVNLSYNYCKRNFRVEMKSIDVASGSEFDSAKAGLRNILADESEESPEAAAQKSEMHELLYRAIGRLSDDHRAVIVLRDIEGMSYDQMAEVLEIENGTVKSRLARARDNLRVILEEMI